MSRLCLQSRKNSMEHLTFIHRQISLRLFVPLVALSLAVKISSENYWAISARFWRGFGCNIWCDLRLSYPIPKWSSSFMKFGSTILRNSGYKPRQNRAEITTRILIASFSATKSRKKCDKKNVFVNKGAFRMQIRNNCNQCNPDCPP